MDDGNSSLRTMDVYILKNGEDQRCYENAILMQDWTSKCEFLTRGPADGTVAVQGVTQFTHILANSTKLQDINLNDTRVYIDNSPFPNGIVRSYEPLTVYVMKENIYSTSSTLTTVSYSLILIFAMIFAVIIGQSFKYHRLREQFKRDQEGFKNAYDVANGTSAVGLSGGKGPIPTEARARATSNDDTASLLSNSRDHMLINQTIGPQSNKNTLYRPSNSRFENDDSDDDSNIPDVPIISRISHQ